MCKLFLQRTKLTVLFLAAVFALSSCGGENTARYDSSLEPPASMGDSIVFDPNPTGMYWLIHIKQINMPQSDKKQWLSEHDEVKRNFLDRVSNKHDGDGPFFYVGVKNIEITADNTIEGVAPGGNLASFCEMDNFHFSVVPSYPNCTDGWTLSSKKDLTSFAEITPLLPWKFGIKCNATIPSGSRITIKILVEDETVGDRVIKGSTLIP